MLALRNISYIQTAPLSKHFNSWSSPSHFHNHRMAVAGAGLMSGPPIFFRQDSATSCWVHSGYMEKRQLFLRSYKFSRKRSSLERVRLGLVRVRRLVWLRLRAARRRLRRCLLWFSLARYDLLGCRRFHRLVRHPHRRRTGDKFYW